MFILQNIREFIDNPMGKGSTAIPSRHLIKEDLNRRFEELINNNKDKKIELTIYRDGDEYYFHFLIPSESKERRNTYDVVLYFTLGEDGKDFASDKNLNRYFVKFFSNSPGFIYTYAYAFNLYGLLIESFANKYNKVVLEQPPVTRNPGEIISYEKTTYFACYYLLKNPKYLNKSTINLIAKPYKEEILNKKIRNEDKIKMEIAQEKRRVEREKKEEEKKLKGLIRSDKRIEPRTHEIKKTKKVSPINKIKPKAKLTPKKSTINKIKP